MKNEKAHCPKRQSNVKNVTVMRNNTISIYYRFIGRKVLRKINVIFVSLIR